MKALYNKRGASALGILGYIIAVILILWGLINLYSLAAPGAANATGRIIIGVILIAIGAGLLFFIPKWESRRPQQIEMTQKIDLAGDVNAEKMKCQNCGADLDKNSVVVKAGGIFVNCPYCRGTYQITEEPKW
ncbi:MAG: hypothetical protein JW765_00230 [Deltaproteobacteria bacterium]|nr:hypothetical protein [Candidatus Zymogenaceae bacterium]